MLCGALLHRASYQQGVCLEKQFCSWLDVSQCIMSRD